MSRAAMYLTVVFLCLSLSLGAGASSLWSTSRSMYTETKTRQVGDLITLVIVESSQAVQRAETSMGQSSEVSVKPGGGILSSLLPFLKLGGGDQAKASGQTTRAGPHGPDHHGLLRCCPVEICALKDGSSSLSTMKSRS